MKFKYKFLLLLIAISLVGCLYVSQSYAFWMVTQEQKNPNQVTSGCFSLSFTEVANHNSINLGNTYPVNDTLGLSQTPYEFTIKNTCTISASYRVILSSLTAASGTTAIDDSKIKYALHKTGNGSTKPQTGTILSSVSTKNSEKSSLKDANSIKNSYQIDTGTLSGGTRGTDGPVTNGGTATYDLYLWIDENATINDAAGKTFKANIDVLATTSNQ